MKPPDKPPTPLHVLVVEDDADTALTWLWLLRRLGHEVALAADGPAAVQAAEARTPDVVLLDLGLPGLTGYEVAARIRQRKAGPRPVLIAVTGFGADDDRLRAYEAGIDLHLVKPVALGELKSYLDRLLTVRARA